MRPPDGVPEDGLAIGAKVFQIGFIGEAVGTAEADIARDGVERRVHLGGEARGIGEDVVELGPEARPEARKLVGAFAVASAQRGLKRAAGMRYM